MRAVSTPSNLPLQRLFHSLFLHYLFLLLLLLLLFISPGLINKLKHEKQTICSKKRQQQHSIELRSSTIFRFQWKLGWKSVGKVCRNSKREKKSRSKIKTKQRIYLRSNFTWNSPTSFKWRAAISPYFGQKPAISLN